VVLFHTFFNFKLNIFRIGGVQAYDVLSEVSSRKEYDNSRRVDPYKFVESLLIFSCFSLRDEFYNVPPSHHPFLIFFSFLFFFKCSQRVLSLGKSAGLREIIVSYRKLARVHHPDKGKILIFMFHGYVFLKLNVLILS
jgi:curved DNA-binding protein CbpA